MTIFVDPPFYAMATSEVLPFAFDASAQLGEGQVCSTPTATLTDETAGTEAVLPSGPTATGHIVRQVVDGSNLQATRRYLLVIDYTPAPGIRRSMALRLLVEL